MTTTRKYTPASIYEEFACEWCGQPVEQGDNAYEVFPHAVIRDPDHDGIGSVCSKSCAERWHARYLDRQDAYSEKDEPR